MNKARVYSVHSEDGKVVGTLADLPTGGCLLLKNNEENTIELGFGQSTNGPILSLDNTIIKVMLSCIGEHFFISLFDAETKQPKSAIAIGANGLPCFLQYDAEGQSYEVSLEDFVTRQVHKVLEQKSL